VVARAVCAGILGAAALVAGGGSAGAARLGTCTTTGLSASAGYKVVALTASGVSCSKARSVAAQIAGELAHGRPIAVAGVEGFAINTTMCGGCKPTTQVALRYPAGKVTISIGGKGSAGNAPSPPAPAGGPYVLA
jgi:hypothetical protein